MPPLYWGWILLLYFDYNGVSCKDIIETELLVVDFDSADGTSGLSREISRAELNTQNDMPLHFNTKYSDVYSRSFSLVKKDGTAFTDLEVRKVNKWLTSPKIPKWLTGYSHDFGDNTNYQGLFNVDSYKLRLGKAIAINVTFTANSPYSWSDEIVKEYNVSGESNFSIDCDNDEGNGYVYPIIIITPTSGHSVEDATNLYVSIENISDITAINNKVKVHVYEGLPLTINCKSLKVSDLAGNKVSAADLGWEDVGYIYWLRLLDGENKLKITGDAKVEIKYREPRKKVGV